MNITTKLECVGYIAWDADNVDEGCAQGMGKTEAEAINDLVEQLVERADGHACKVADVEITALRKDLDEATTF